MNELFTLLERNKELELQNTQINIKREELENKIYKFKASKYPIIYILNESDIYPSYEEAKEASKNLNEFYFIEILNLENEYKNATHLMKKSFLKELSKDPYVIQIKNEIKELDNLRIENNKEIRTNFYAREHLYKKLKDEYCKLNPLIYIIYNKEDRSVISRKEKLFSSYKDALDEKKNHQIIRIMETSKLDVEEILRIPIVHKLL